MVSRVRHLVPFWMCNSCCIKFELIDECGCGVIFEYIVVLVYDASELKEE